MYLTPASPDFDCIYEKNSDATNSIAPCTPEKNLEDFETIE
jgi:hypothetical protein